MAAELVRVPFDKVESVYLPIEVGIAQSDWQHHAFQGTGPFEFADVDHRNLRTLFSMHGEPFTLVARRKAGIRTLDDLAGKRVNIGNPGSGQRATMEVVMEAKGWTMKDFQLTSELKSAEQSKALCDNKIDAMVFTVGHPSGSIKEATTSCDSVLVPVTGPEIDALVNDNDYYRHATVPGGMYRGTDSDTQTFGVGATFVSSTAVPAEVVYVVVKAVFDNFDQFKKLHPAFANLKETEMITDSLSAPVHPGAAKYYKERGWM